MANYNKLVRDKIPDIIKAAGKKVVTRVLEPGEVKIYFNAKLEEELQEFLESGEVEKLAEHVEVVYGILATRGISLETFEQIRLEKLAERGGFEKKLVLERVLEV